MIGDIHLQDLFFEGELRALIPFHPIGLGDVLDEARIRVVCEHVEHAHLASGFILLTFGCIIEQRCFIHKIHKLLTRVAGRIERTRLDERFKRLAVIA